MARLKKIEIKAEDLLELLRFLDGEETIPGSAWIAGGKSEHYTPSFGVNREGHTELTIYIADPTFPEQTEGKEIPRIESMVSTRRSEILRQIIAAGRRAASDLEYREYLEKVGDG